MSRYLQKIFECDARSIAIFRIALGILLLIEVAWRFPYVEMLFADPGIYPFTLARFQSPYSWSLNYISGEVWFQQAILFALAIAALFLCIGLFTRIATIGCWLLLVSIHVRNPMVLIGGDAYIRLILFWSMFIPLGQRWSIDCFWRSKNSRKKNESPERDPVASDLSESNRIYCVGIVCLILQICMVYWSAGISKLNANWFDGSALGYVLGMRMHARPLGERLMQYPTLIQMMSWSTIFVEILIPCLLLIPFRNGLCRIIVLVLVFSIHFGIELTIDVGLFGAVCIVAVIPLIRWPQKNPKQDPVLDAASRSKIWHWKFLSKFTQNVTALFFLGLVSIWNLDLLINGPEKTDRFIPSVAYPIAAFSMVSQDFRVFGEPVGDDTLFVFYARTRDGKEFDLLGDPSREISRPPKVSSGVTRLEKIVHRSMIKNSANRAFQHAMLVYFVDRWNQSHDRKHSIVEARIEYYFGKKELQRGFDVTEWFEPESANLTIDEKIDDIDSFLKNLDRDIPF